MKEVFQLNENENLTDAINNVIKGVHGKKIKPGQKIFLDPNGKVLKVGTFTGLDNLVEQAYGEQLNVNNLLKPAIDKGLLRHGVTFEGEYDDIPAGDFQEAQFIVAKGKSMFEALPAAIRNKFEGQPDKFMSFVQNPINEPWLREQGIIKSRS